MLLMVWAGPGFRTAGADLIAFIPNFNSKFAEAFKRTAADKAKICHIFKISRVMMNT